MIIESVAKDKKHCVCVAVGGERLLIDRDVAAEYSLRSGREITAGELQEVCERSEYVRARERALWYLDRADRTERTLYKKLREAGFRETAAAKVIARLRELGLLDDRRYAQNAADSLARQNISPREIKRRLYEKGVPREIINEVCDGCDIDEAAQIRALIDKKYSNKLGCRADVEKVYAALVRRGFSFGAVREALRRYSEELENLSEESV